MIIKESATSKCVWNKSLSELRSFIGYFSSRTKQKMFAKLKFRMKLLIKKSHIMLALLVTLYIFNRSFSLMYFLNDRIVIVIGENEDREMSLIIPTRIFMPSRKIMTNCWKDLMNSELAQLT